MASTHVDTLREQLRIHGAVVDELQRQADKWGHQRRHPLILWHLILAEEMGELAQAILEYRSPERIAEEIVQCVAVLVQLSAANRAGASRDWPAPVDQQTVIADCFDHTPTPR